MKKCIDCNLNEVRNKRSSLCDKCFEKAFKRKVAEQPEQSWW
ncbi:hypothetical protein J11TS1_39460 [Oceanobacillus sp. J11TS1]|nr:hypothetical protein J11TS1_39460 [Oceanobacillus sp. J11TS1]